METLLAVVMLKCVGGMLVGYTNFGEKAEGFPECCSGNIPGSRGFSTPCKSPVGPQLKETALLTAVLLTSDIPTYLADNCGDTSAT